MKRLAYIMMLVLATSAMGQHAWRGKVKPQAESPAGDNTASTGAAMQPADSGAVSCSGFEKTLRSGIESFFVTNHTDSALSRLHVTLDYTDISGRQLHSRSQPISVDIPAGQTRRVEIKSFDRQATFYYYLSPAPRTRSTATPFKVHLRVDSLAH